MTIKELRDRYYFHDSCITRIDYKDKKLEMILDFCQWAQEWYKKTDPENVWMRLIFSGIEQYEGITGEIDYFSVLDAEIKEDKLWIFMLDDFHNENYEIFLKPTDVEVEILGVVED